MLHLTQKWKVLLVNEVGHIQFSIVLAVFNV